MQHRLLTTVLAAVTLLALPVLGIGPPDQDKQFRDLGKRDNAIGQIYRFDAQSVDGQIVASLATSTDTSFWENVARAAYQEGSVNFVITGRGEDIQGAGGLAVAVQEVGSEQDFFSLLNQAMIDDATALGHGEELATATTTATMSASCEQKEAGWVHTQLTDFKGFSGNETYSATTLTHHDGRPHSGGGSAKSTTTTTRTAPATGPPNLQGTLVF